MADNGKEVTPAQAAPGSDAQPAPKPPAAQQAPAAALPQPSPAAQGGAAGGSASVPVGPATGKRLSLGAGSAAKGDDSDVILQRLREFVEKEGGQWDEGWRVEKKMRASGNTAGTFDVYYFSPGGKRFRSRTEVARFLGLAPEPEKKSGKAASGKAAASKPAPIVTFSREEAVQRAKDAAGDLAMHVPLLLPDGVTVTRLGEADPRPAYHTATQLWPVGYEARVADAQVGTFVCVIRDGGAGGPIFRVRLDPAGKDNGAKLLAEGKDPGDVWSKVAARQQAALDATLALSKAAAASKKAATAAARAAAAAAAAAPPQAEPPAPAAAPQAAQAPSAPAQADAPEPGSIAARLAAMAARPGVDLVPGARPGSAQPGPSAGPPKSAAQQLASLVNAGIMPSMPSAPAAAPAGMLTPQPPQDPVDALLTRAAPLAGVWGLQRYGMADVRVLKLLEAIPGADRCSAYHFVEQRSSWEAEERRLNKEAERWRKLGNKANKGVEKKEKQLGSAVDKAEKKRKRETDKEPAQGGARGSAKAPRKQEGRAGEAAAAVNGPGSGRKAVRRRSGVGTYRKQGTTELEKDVGHVMDKLLDKIEAAAEREARREEAKQQRRREHEAEKEARAAQRAAQRQEAKSEKERAKEAAKGERRHQAGAERDARLAASGTSLDVSDELLPGAQNPPPPPQPIGSGKLAPELSGAVVEVWEFLGRFSELLQVDAPHLAALEAALAEPQGENAQVVAAAALPLLDLLVSEAVEAALDLTAEANPDVKRRDLGGAFPPVREDCWTEVTRRYLDLCGASRMVASSEASGGLDTALGTLVGSAPLAVLGPAVTLQTLMTGPRGGDPRSGLAGLPLGASRSAPDAIMVRQDAASLAAAEQLLREAGGPAAAAEAAAQTRTKKACRHILWDLFNLLGPKDHTGAKATCRTLCYEGNAAAAAARTARPLDLMTVAARVDQGVYSRMDDGLAAFASDVRGVCETMRAACRRANSPFAARMAERRASEMADLLEATLDSLVDKHGSGSAGNTKTAGRTAHELANGDSKEEGGEPAAAANGLAGVPGQERSSAVDDVSRPFQPVEGCCMCWANEDPHRILLCDGCDAGYHIYCLDPPLGEIPAGEWYCPACARERQLHQKLPFAHRHVDLAEDDCWTAAQQLGQHTAAELGPACLVAILSLLAGLASCTAATRQHLLSQEEKRKELRKELVELRVRLKREENERLNEERERLAAAHQAAKPAGEAAAGPGPVPEPSAAVAAKQGGREGAAGGKAAKGTKRKAGGEAGEEGEGQAERKPRTRGAGGEGEQLVPEVALARMEELVLQIQRLVGRREPLGYDRHWNRYWLLGSPASPIGSVFVEARPGGKAPQDDCPPSSAEGSQTVATSSAAATASAWGCYQTVAQLEQLIEFLNVRGAREGPLRKALQKVRQRMVDAGPVQAVPAAAADEANAGPGPVEQETAAGGQPVAAGADEDLPGAGALQLAATSAEAAAAVATAAGPAAADGPAPAEPAAPAAPLSELEALRSDILALADAQPGEAFDAVRGSAGRLARWRALVEGAKGAQALLAGLVVLEGALRGDRLKPWWRLWAFPTPDIEAAGTCAAVRLRLHALRAAIKRGGAAAAQREPASYAHAGGGYSFRQASRLAPGALAEKSFGGGTDDSGAEDSDAGGRRPAKRTRFGQRAAGDSKVAQGDAALAWQLQQELNSSRRAARAGGRAPGGDARETRHSSRLHPAQDDRRRSGRHSGSASGKGKRTPRDTPNTSAPASDASDDDLQVNEDSGSNSDGPAPMRKTRAQLAREELEEPGSEEKPATVAVHGRRRLRKAA